MEEEFICGVIIITFHCLEHNKIVTKEHRLQYGNGYNANVQELPMNHKY